MLINFKSASRKVLRQKKATLQEMFSLIEAQMQEFYNHAVWVCDDEKLAAKAIEAIFPEIRMNVNNLSRAECLKCELFKILKSQCELQKIQGEGEGSYSSVKKSKSNQSEHFLTLREALKSLNSYYSEPLAMQIVSGFTVDEIANYLAVSQPLVLDRLSIAREKLLMLMHDDGSLSEVSNASFLQKNLKNTINNGIIDVR